MVVNRVLAELPDAAELTSARIAPALKKKLKRNLADYAALKAREEVSLDALRDSIPAGAVLMAKLLSNFLYGIKPTDPATFITTFLILAAVALAACAIPARQALKIDPVIALRYE